MDEGASSGAGTSTPAPGERRSKGPPRAASADGRRAAERDPERFAVGNRAVVVRDCDIARLGEHVDAIVSSDDNYLSHGGGVSAALWEAAGHELADYVKAHPASLRLGDVHATAAGRLDASRLLHAVTVDLDTSRSLGPREARLLYGAVLDTAAALGCASVATPLLGAGLAGMGESGSAAALADALDQRSAFPSSVERIVVAAVGDGFEACVGALGPRSREAENVGDLIAKAAAVVGGKTGARILRIGELVAVSNEASSGMHEAILLELCLQGLVERGLGIANRLRSARERREFASARKRLVGIDSAGLVALRPDRAVPVGAKLGLAEDLFLLAGKPLPGRLSSVCREAVAARNRLAHTTAADRDQRMEFRRAILKWAEGICAWIVEQHGRDEGGEEGRPTEAHPDVALPEGTAAGAGAAADEDARKAGKPPPEPAPGAGDVAEAVARAPATTRAETARSGTGHVRRLHSFLLETMEPDDLRDFASRLAREGYRGERDLCLLEYCVRMPDPAGFLASEFSARRLRREVQKRAGLPPKPDADARELAEDLLDFFGYPPTHRPPGLKAVTESVGRLRARVHTANLVELRGIVTGASAWLEYVVLILLRFVCQAVFRTPPEPYFQQSGRLESWQWLSKCTLGKLLDLLEGLASDLENADDVRVAALKTEFEARRLSPRGAMSIAGLRNRFAHFKSLQESWPVAEARKAALEFFEVAGAFLGYLREPEHRVFPHIISIERIQIDRWGRRLVDALDDEEMEEHIFTDEPLSPGAVYYMHPTTNPLRVDPILIAAGDLECPAGGKGAASAEAGAVRPAPPGARPEAGHGS